ncbi:MAG: protein phosphatase 2C domain-containing protein [Patescibacteria group bacterium]
MDGEFQPTDSKDKSLSKEWSLPSIDMGGSLLTSRNHQDLNKPIEDEIRIARNSRFAILCDGMGGHDSGEVAAQLAINTMYPILDRMPATSPVQEIHNSIGTALDTAHRQVVNYRESNNKDSMGTTAVALFIKSNPDGSRQAVIGSIGDSRAYIYDQNRNLTHITVDDSRLMKRLRDLNYTDVQLRIEQAKHSEAAQLTQEDAFLSQAIGGHSQLAIRITTLDLSPGDMIILASDGVTDPLRTSEIQDIIRKNESKTADDLATLLINQAEKVKGGREKDDDRSTIVIKIGPNEIPQGVSSDPLHLSELTKPTDLVDIVREHTELGIPAGIILQALHGSESAFASIPEGGLKEAVKRLKKQ